MPEYTLQSDHASVIAIDQHARSVTLYDSQADGLDVFHDVGEAVSWANEHIGSIDAS